MLLAKSEYFLEKVWFELNSSLVAVVIRDSHFNLSGTGMVCDVRFMTRRFLEGLV